MNLRRGALIFILVNVLTVGFLVHSVWTLLTLLVVDGSADAISRAELPGPNSDPIEGKPAIIPKIIHQTYANTSIPAHWKEAQQSCIDLHPDYEYKLWTDKGAREFIASEYPWFLETFDGYRFPIQRADAIRYFVLAHFGGIYIDLDDVSRVLTERPVLWLMSMFKGCNRRLDPLLTYPAWLRRTVPTGISNDAMGSVPHHPFFLKAIDALPKYDRSWFLPYVTVMGSTGPLFLSVIWRHYNSKGPVPEDQRVRILFPDEYSKHSWSFFTHHLGNSWHQKDVQLILWASRHWIFLTAMGFLTAGVVFMGLWWAYGRFLISNNPKAHSIRRRFPFPFLRKVSAKSRNSGDYELLGGYAEDRLEA